ncbi:craniofacial development protein 2 [Elysia marginata]|uniref:Craniofacial development protein 2 n=1 Tax=Elysia marginata TaxID=1093978 RepID=A0AAV4INE2_9GAST|nr:craniofacial development protein 2 [Elysia marginata]
MTHIFSALAPTLTFSEKTNDVFYEKLEEKIRGIRDKENLILLEDFNNRVGADYSSNYICHFGVGKLNENGQRLPELCSFNKLRVTNTFFAVKPHHTVSWRHLIPKHGHQLDLIIARKTMLKHVSLTRSYRSADCDTDHPPVVSKKNEDWFKAGIDLLDPAIAAKGTSHVEYTRKQSAKNLAINRKSLYNAKTISRKCANDYWLRLCGDIQSAADSGNTRAMYEGMKKASGASVVKVASLKSPAVRSSRTAANKWRDGRNTIKGCSLEKTLSATKLSSTQRHFPQWKILMHPITIDELRKTIDTLSCGKLQVAMESHQMVQGAFKQAKSV